MFDFGDICTRVVFYPLHLITPLTNCPTTNSPCTLVDLLSITTLSNDLTMNHWPTKGIPTRNLNARAGDYKCPSPMKLIE